MTLEIHLDRKKDYRWRLRARNGRIIAESGEGYQRKAALMQSLRKVFIGYEILHDFGVFRRWNLPGVEKAFAVRDLTK